MANSGWMATSDPFGPEMPYFQHMCAMVSARFVATDLADFFARIRTGGVDPMSPSALILPIHESGTRIFETDYADLLSALCRSFSFVPQIDDVLRSAFDELSVNKLSLAVSHGRSQCRVVVERENAWYVIQGPELFTEIAWRPMSQVHSEVSQYIQHFLKMLTLFDGDASRMFWRPASASAFSVFLEGWTASRLGAPLVPRTEPGIVVVG